MAVRFALGLLLCSLALLALACGSSSARPRGHSVAAPDLRGCPLTDHHPGVSPDPATRTTLVPAGATGLTLCRYRGLNPSPTRAGTLMRSRRINDANKLRRPAAALDGLPLFPSGAYSCPADDGSEIIARFAYPHASLDPVVIELTGCEGVGNGHRTLWWAAQNSALVGELEALTR